MKIHSLDHRYSDRERQNGDLRTDSKGKEVQMRIMDAKNRLKGLASDHVLNEEEKERKRREIQQQLEELKKELKKRQLQSAQQGRASAADAAEEPAQSPGREPAEAKEAASRTPDAEHTHTGARAILAAGSAVSHAGSHGRLASEMESRVRILQGEIRQDEARGQDTGYKQRELKKLETKAARLNGAGMNALADASKELKTAMERENGLGKKARGSSPDGFVRPLKSPFSAAPKAKTDIYLRRNPFSTVDFHF